MRHVCIIRDRYVSSEARSWLETQKREELSADRNVTEVDANQAFVFSVYLLVLENSLFSSFRRRSSSSKLHPYAGG